MQKGWEIKKCIFQFWILLVFRDFILFTSLGGGQTETNTDVACTISVTICTMKLIFLHCYNFRSFSTEEASDEVRDIVYEQLHKT